VGLLVSPTQVAFNARGDGKFSKPFVEQQSFFKQKLPMPSQHYDDILNAAHDRAFMVAGATKADLLTDLKGAVDKAIAEGHGLDWFRKQFDGIVKKHGWEGWTGSGTAEGRDWRTRVIYQTNLSSSYAAGRYGQLTRPEVLEALPYWKYVHNDSVAHPRPLHVAWSGTVLKHDDPWWGSHYPPCGWLCRCRVEPVDASEFDGKPAPDDGEYTKVDRYGVEHTMPKGVDYGFGYTPGKSLAADTQLRAMVQDKLVRYAPAISRSLTKDVNRYINADKKASSFAGQALADADVKALGWLGFVARPEVLKPLVHVDMTGFLVLLPADAVRHAVNKHAFDGKGQRAVKPADFDRVAQVLNEGDAVAGDGDGFFVSSLVVGGETFRCVFEVMGAKMRAVALKTLMIKTAK